MPSAAVHAHTLSHKQRAGVVEGTRRHGAAGMLSTHQGPRGLSLLACLELPLTLRLSYSSRVGPGNLHPPKPEDDGEGTGVCTFGTRTQSSQQTVLSR